MSGYGKGLSSKAACVCTRMFIIGFHTGTNEEMFESGVRLSLLACEW